MLNIPEQEMLLLIIKVGKVILDHRQIKIHCIMRKILLLTYFVLFIQYGNTQTLCTKDFFSQVTYEKGISIMDVNADDLSIITIYYEFSYNKESIVLGEGCIFAMPKDLCNSWTKDAVSSPLGKCKEKVGKKDIYYIYCTARQYFKDIKRLMAKFDIYTFFVAEKYLDGPYLEATESGSAVYYNIKPDSNISIYKYENSKWEIIEEQELKNKTPRTFGESYIESIFTKKITE